MKHSTMTEAESTSDGAIADPRRAREIAAMDELSIDEFRELTGIGISRYGIYSIDSQGVSVGTVKDMAELTARQQHKLSLARKALSLSFPCTPARFVEWFIATQGKPDTVGAERIARAPSDFPLAKGFLAEFDRLNSAGKRDTRHAVPKQDIIAAFPVKPSPDENAKWWAIRLRDVDNYGLAECRARKGQRGRGDNPSYWYSQSIAAWLIDKGHMKKRDVISAMEANFPTEDLELLDEI